MRSAPFVVKAAVAALLAAAFAAGGAWLAARTFFPEPRVRAWFVDAARRELGRDVRLEGIGIGPRGLSLKGLEVSERAGFAAGTFLRVETFRLRPSWRALLKRRLVVSGVAADGLAVRVVQGADGRFNYETPAVPAKPAAPSAPSAAPAESPFELRVRRAEISNGTIEYADASGVTWTMTAVDAAASNIGPAGPFGLKTSFRFRGGGKLAAEGRAAFDGLIDRGAGGGEPAATVKSLSVESRGVKLTASGTAARRRGATRIDAKWTAQALGFPAGQGALKADLSPNADELKISELTAATKAGAAEVSGTIRGLSSGRKTLALRVKGNSLVLDALGPLTPWTRDLNLSGTASCDLALTGPADEPAYAGTVEFSGVGASAAGLPFSGFTGSATFDANVVDVPRLAGKIAGGGLELNLTVKDYARAPDIRLEAALESFDLGRYLAAKMKFIAAGGSSRALAPAPSPGPATAAASGSPEPSVSEKSRPISTRGHLSIGTLTHPNATVTNVKVAWNLRGVAADLHGLNGDAQLEVGGGSIRSAGDMAEQSKLVKVLIFPLLIVQKVGSVGGLKLFPDFNDISLKRIVGDYAFADGLMTLRKSEMDSNAARLIATGAINLPAEALDLEVKAQIGNVLPIDFAVTGTFASPKARIDTGKLFADPAKLIQGLFGR
ncbi:MAG: AsmA-like C-terminal region-containing protein [Elusimicrobiota bacterium]